MEPTSSKKKMITNVGRILNKAELEQERLGKAEEKQRRGPVVLSILPNVATMQIDKVVTKFRRLANEQPIARDLSVMIDECAFDNIFN